ncbi:SPOR domain-containing protein [Vibrio agarivorans]|uniref:SPOR domain-containing protein n=1 Tax=Vibrio agarivorans TaxID=153622 RepID=UPI00222E7DCE|nr:SPOR domain-containing protein [Vibrio agarivorans]
MAKDYVKRGRGTPKRPTKRSTPRRKPWRSGLLAILLLGIFSYGLYQLGQDPEPQAPVAVQPKPQPKPAPKPKKVLPPKPEEKWDYVETLPNRQIEVEAKELQVSDIPYIMQCGAYKSLEQAESRKLDIAFQGIESKVRKTEGSSWYRVVLGPYDMKRDAERDRHRLERAKIEPCAIWKDSQ